MAQFDIHQYAKQTGPVRLVVDLQCDLLQALQTRVVAPVYEKASSHSGLQGLAPEFEFHGKTYFVSMAELAAIHRRELGKCVGSLVERRNDLVAGVDLIFTGI